MKRRQRGTRRLLAALVGVSLIAAACGDSDTDDADDSATDTAADSGDTDDGGDTDDSGSDDSGSDDSGSDDSDSDDSAGADLVVALSDTTDLIELHTFRSTSAYSITGALYEAPLRQVLDEDENGLLVGTDEVEGAGAESYEIVETDDGGYLATFHLRPEAKFAETGNPVTAEDYKYVFDRAIDGPGYIGLLLPFIGVESTDQVRVVDELTFEVETTVQSPLFERFMTFQVFGAMEKAVAEENATEDDPWAFDYFNTHAAGSGPFMIETYEPETTIELVPNPYYWDLDEVAPGSVTIRNVTDASQRALLLERGELDVADGLPPRLVADMDGNDAVQVFGATTTGVEYLGMNTTIAPLDNVDVRKAIALAVPYDGLVEQVMYDQALPAQGVVTSTMDTFDPEVGAQWATDLEAAQAALDASGVSDVSLALGVRESRTTNQEAAVLIQDALRQIGIEVDIQILADGDFLTKLGNDELPLYIHDWSSWGEDPFYQMSFLTTCDGGVNYSHYCNADYDAAVNEGMFTADEAVRQEASSTAQQLFVDDAPWAPLWSADRTIVAGECVGGVVRDYTMVLGFKYLTKTDC